MGRAACIAYVDAISPFAINAEFEDVVAIATKQHVRARTTVQHVVSGPAVEYVCTRIADQGLIEAGAVEDVVVSVARDGCSVDTCACKLVSDIEGKAAAGRSA